MRAAGKADCGFLTLKNQTRRQLDLITFEFVLAGGKKDEKRTVVERITLYVDGKKYQDDNIDEYDLSEYTGEEMPGEDIWRTTSLPLIICLKMK